MIPIIFVKILAVVMALSLAMIFLIYANRLKKAYTDNLMQYDASTIAKVSRQWKKEVLLENGETSTTWYVDYKYVVGSAEYEKCSDTGHYKKMFTDDAEVQLMYKSNNPEEFYVIAENGSDRTTYKILFALGYIVIGLLVALIILLNKYI